MEFLNGNEEDANLNQYWYSTFTIQKIVEDIQNQIQSTACGRIGFLSTPSIYFSLDPVYRNECFVFDFDRKWESDRGFIWYDFNDTQCLPASIHGTFDMVVIDPPFITKEVWEKYAAAAKLLLKPDGGKVILTTIQENSELLFDLLGATPTNFLPSIPHLVYQYNLFTNYSSEVFSQKNPEIADW
mmetsp:Transcript_3014/g.4216  ORF Transcript_3014/g.4216 Transcript_3014/m.4216 type:complete len:185 (-) Transcript_3014:48-602(-)